MPLKPYLRKLMDRQPLTEAEAAAACEIMVGDSAPMAQVGAMMAALTLSGEDLSPVLCGMALDLHTRSRLLTSPAGAVDICGTGGDGKGTYNISTAAAIIAAGCGVPVAKHGNVRSSSRSGSADVLAALDININAPLAVVQRSLDEAGCCFMLSPRHHEAMRNVAQVRADLGAPTIFDLLIPLVNPAGVKRHLIGVRDPIHMEPMAKALRRLRADVAWVVHGDDGIDEITTTTTTQVVELRMGKITRFEIQPEDAGLHRVSLNDLRGADPATNAAAMHGIFDGRPSAYREIALFNAGAALLIAGKAQNLREAVRMAAKAVDDGRAAGVLALVSTIYAREPARLNGPEA